MILDNTLNAFCLNRDLETKGDLSLRSIVLVWKDLKWLQFGGHAS